MTTHTLPRILRWEEPPPSTHTRNMDGAPPSPAWQEVADQLRQRCGEWALVVENAGATPSLATRIRNGEMAAFRPAGDFEAASRQRAGEPAKVYVRYLGDGGDVR
ncbi:hypothetical protein GCM10010172_35210 [Paractinoplanes ferrugineus]|uniref:Uncharacterized protein n=1 Tax=Paractinoplanes ferrugineus TaxID=113564 RepID=A0A919JB14_9ACTN|nr:hypothetical protein [Actinoplanes ferrugineus]GIE16769.1 hypothetical protein Afe05nite_86090 [Actinoplanes ferrugineus]